MAYMGEYLPNCGELYPDSVQVSYFPHTKETLYLKSFSFILKSINFFCHISYFIYFSSFPLLIHSDNPGLNITIQPKGWVLCII